MNASSIRGVVVRVWTIWNTKKKGGRVDRSVEGAMQDIAFITGEPAESYVVLKGPRNGRPSFW